MTPRWLLAACAAVLGLLLAGALPAAAASTVTSGAGLAYLRLAHLSPDTPDVDVYVGSVADPAGSFTVAGVGYGALSAYRPVEPGSYVISMRAAGAPADSPPVIATSVDVRPGGAYTVAGVGMSAALGLSVLTDRLDMPAPGRASVRLINGAPSVPTVDAAAAGGPVWARDVRFGTTTGYSEVPLGTWDLQVTAAGRAAATLPVRLDANSVYSVLLVDRDGSLVAELHRDSAGTGVVPVGGVETGLGGTASATGPVVAGALVAALAGALLVARARPRRAHGR